MKIIHKKLVPLYFLYTLVFNMAAIGFDALSNTVFLINAILIAAIIFITGYYLNTRIGKDRIE